MAWTSGYGDLPDGDAVLHEMVAERAAKAGDRPALIDGPTGEVVTYETLASRADRVAAGLAERGFGAGDVLALWAPNGPPWAGVTLGALAAGGTLTGINPAYTERELKAQLADSGASVVVTVPPLVPAALSAAPATGVREVIVLGPTEGEAEGATSVLDLIGSDGTVPDVAADPDGVALLPYSSGTTGLPKGVMLTHSNLVASVRQVGSGLRMTERDTTLAVAPFFHIMGFVVSLAVPLASGATVLTMPRFDLAQFFALIERHRVTVLGVPPPVMAALVRHPLAAEHDLTSLELIVSGGAPLGADLQREEAARFPHATVGQAWGMTETTVGAPCPTASWAPRRAPSGASCPPPSCASWSPTPDGTLG